MPVSLRRTTTLRKRIIPLLPATLLCVSTHAAKPNVNAPKGGILVRNIQGEPTSLHPLLANDLYAQFVHSYVLDSLVDRDLETFEFKPRLAEKWETSDDGRLFTFHLRKDVKFHDGKPLTAEDVKFSLESVFDKNFGSVHWTPFFEGLDHVEIVDPLTVKVHLKNNYFLNFAAIGSFNIFPKHIYGDAQKSKRLTRELMGSGPYKLERFDRGIRIVLQRNEDWFGFKAPEWRGFGNFNTIVFRFVKDEKIALELAKNGEIDFDYPVRPEIVEDKDLAESLGKSLVANRVENLLPKRYMFVGWNFQQQLFQDKNVRIALAHLMNREEINKKFRHGNSLLATGPTFIQSEYAPSSVKPIPYNPNKAKELLAKAGWSDPKKGILEKDSDGKKIEFRFTLLHSNKDYEKYWTIFREDLKKVGIEMNIKFVEWGAFLKLLDAGKFDAVALGWGGSFDWDPKPIWHSASAVPGGSNFIHYRNTDVDKLIDQARFESDKRTRTGLLRNIYELIAADAPYIFMFNDKYEYYLNSSKIERPADTFAYDIGHEYWWTKQK
ncbi:MAG: peptide ABC transporter substrate-binding protein [Bdellovibrio sp.]|nr:MAG: peptide ABC transporter substrate-binding protein [Bdellovibrio sp.]